MEGDRAGMPSARSGEMGDSSGARFIPENIRGGGFYDDGGDEKEKKALDFHESDPAFRIFICRYPIGPVFVIISMVKLLLLLAALLTTMAQLLVVHSATSSSSSADDEHGNSTTMVATMIFTTPKSSIDAVGTNSEGERLSWASAIYYFEPSWWLALAYVRLTIAIAAIFSVLFGLYGMWSQRRLFLLSTAVVDCGLVLFLLGYLVLLAWHAVKYDDYFAFCIGGLALLSLLLISVMGLHAAIVAHRYLRSMLAFLAAAKNRWPDAYDQAVAFVRRRQAQQRGILSLYYRLTQRYAIAGEIMRIEEEEMAVIHPHGGPTLLEAIEEGDSEYGDEQKTP